MKRSRFLVLAAMVPWLFGAVMMVAPDLMLSSLAIPYDAATRAVTQWVGFGVFSLGLLTFLARNDSGSPALEGVLLGNMLFHSLGIGFDTYHYLINVMTMSGLISGLVPHAALVIGFSYYFAAIRREARAASGSVLA